MGKNTSIVLGDHFENFVNERVADGRYNSTSEVIRAGLRMLEDEETKMTNLRQALKDGSESGIVENFDMKTFLKKKEQDFERLKFELDKGDQSGYLKGYGREEFFKEVRKNSNS